MVRRSGAYAFANRRVEAAAFSAEVVAVITAALAVILDRPKESFRVRDIKAVGEERRPGLQWARMGLADQLFARKFMSRGRWG